MYICMHTPRTHTHIHTHTHIMSANLCRFPGGVGTRSNTREREREREREIERTKESRRKGDPERDVHTWKKKEIFIIEKSIRMLY